MQCERYIRHSTWKLNSEFILEAASLLSNPFLSVVIPTYNEEQRISLTLQSVVKHLNSKEYEWEIIVVDDGSSDRTISIVEAMSGMDSGIKLLSLEHRGKGFVVKQGMLYARGKYRFVADADLSMSIDQLDRFLPPNQIDADIVIGSRETDGSKRVGEPMKRHLLGRCFNLMVRLIVLKGIQDTQCGFKCFKGETADKIFPLQTANGFSFDVEILFIAQKMGIGIKELGICWSYNEGSKIRLLKDSMSMLKDLCLVRWNSLTGKYKT